MRNDPDLMLIVALVLLVFAIPSIISAFSERRAPRVASLVLLAGGGLLVWAVRSKPGGYRLEEIPEVFISVVARFI